MTANHDTYVSRLYYNTTDSCIRKSREAITQAYGGASQKALSRCTSVCFQASDGSLVPQIVLNLLGCISVESDRGLLTILSALQNPRFDSLSQSEPLLLSLQLATSAVLSHMIEIGHSSMPVSTETDGKSKFNPRGRPFLNVRVIGAEQVLFYQ